MKILKKIAIICCVIGFIMSIYGLVIGIQSIGAEGWNSLGEIFIVPSIISLIIIALDFCIAIGIIKKGLIYSFISSLVKIGVIAVFIPDTIYSLSDEINYHVSNLDFDLILIGSLIVVLIPSIINIIRLSNQRKKK